MNTSNIRGVCNNCLIVLGIMFIVCIVFFFAFVMLVSAAFSSGTDTSGNNEFTTEFVSGNEKAKEKIAVIDVKGTIERGSGEFSADVANSVTIVKLIRAAAKDDDVKAIIIDLETPGGEVTASDEIYHELKLCGKPVVAMMNSMAASGGYYVACGADKIVANKFTMTGSIGVIISTVNVSELLEWAKVKPEFYTSGKMKAMLNPAKPTTEEEAKVIQALVTDAYNQFAGIVSKSRNIPLEKITEGELGDGRVFDGEQALANGLVDKLGYFSTAEDTALELAGLDRDNCRIERYKVNSPLDDILGIFGVNAQPAPVTFNSLLTGTNLIIPKAGCLYYLSTGF